MRRVFLDTSFLKARADAHDDLHARAAQAESELGPYIAVTSQMVLTEFLNFLSGKGEYLRDRAVRTVDMLRAHPNVRIVPQTSDLFDQALALYRARMDKGYSLTDCASMQILSQVGIQDVLTGDKHFEQEGFRALLRIGL